MVRSREGADAVRPLQSAGGTAPEVLTPLDQVQIDHTVIDLIIVDEHDRQPNRAALFDCGHRCV
jgi:putative transposase